jgi:hypothetical protein
MEEVGHCIFLPQITFEGLDGRLGLGLAHGYRKQPYTSTVRKYPGRM